MNKQRIEHLKDGVGSGKYVMYWMQQSQRIHMNHALNLAAEIANKNNLPLVVYFALYGNYPEANVRSFQFMLEGLQDVKKWLLNFGINFVLRIGEGHKVIFDYLQDAHTLVMDKGYLNHQRQWRSYVLEEAIKQQLNLSIEMVDSDLLIPVSLASDKREYGAYTIRPKIMKKFQSFRDQSRLPVLINKTHIDFTSDDDLEDLEQLLMKLEVDQSVKASTYFRGGYIQASRLFTTFIYQDLNDYVDRNDPSDPKLSHMSMYLHFGQISPQDLLERLEFAVIQKAVSQASVDAFIEQLIVRRELAFNFVYYTKNYDQFEFMTQNWAYKTMEKHRFDERPYHYDIQDYETFKTHDLSFNAAMIEMVKTGYMHNYMRMYWAKKIIEWSPTYKSAYETILFLNNKYFIDGRDANSYAGVAWCFGNHDRPWKERDVFGQLRYMNESGLKRKFNIGQYIDSMYRLIEN